MHQFENVLALYKHDSDDGNHTVVCKLDWSGIGTTTEEALQNLINKGNEQLKKLVEIQAEYSALAQQTENMRVLTAREKGMFLMY